MSNRPQLQVTQFQLALIFHQKPGDISHAQRNEGMPRDLDGALAYASIQGMEIDDSALERVRNELVSIASRHNIDREIIHRLNAPPRLVYAAMKLRQNPMPQDIEKAFVWWKENEARMKELQRGERIELLKKKIAWFDEALIGCSTDNRDRWFRARDRASIRLKIEQLGEESCEMRLARLLLERKKIQRWIHQFRTTGCEMYGLCPDPEVAKRRDVAYFEKALKRTQAGIKRARAGDPPKPADRIPHFYPARNIKEACEQSDELEYIGPLENDDDLDGEEWKGGEA